MMLATPNNHHAMSRKSRQNMGKQETIGVYDDSQKRDSLPNGISPRKTFASLNHLPVRKVESESQPSSVTAVESRGGVHDGQ